MVGHARAASSPATSIVVGNNLTFPVVTWGSSSGRPVLLLHGFLNDPLSWSAVAEALIKEGFFVVAPFQRGYTPTARPRTSLGYTYPQFVSDALAITNSMGFATVDVVGIDLGAVEAWMLAARNPSRVRSLTAIRYPHPAALALAMHSSSVQKERWALVQETLLSSSTVAAELLANNADKLRHCLSTSGLPEPFLSRHVIRLQEPGALAAALQWGQAVSLNEFATVPAVTAPTLHIWSADQALARAAIERTKDYVSKQYTEIRTTESDLFILELNPNAVSNPLLRHLRST